MTRIYHDDTDAIEALFVRVKRPGADRVRCVRKAVGAK